MAPKEAWDAPSVISMSTEVLSSCRTPPIECVGSPSLEAQID